MNNALAAIILLAGVSTPAVAQRATEMETGSHIGVPRRARIPESGNLNDADRGRIVMAELARCTLDREYKDVEHALAMPAGQNFACAIAGLPTNECLNSGEVRFQAVAIRGPLFTEMYRRRAAEEQAGRSWGPSLQKISLAEPAGALDDDGKTYLALMAFGDCVMSKDPAAARRVVLAPTASAAEDQEIRAMMPNFSTCLPQGTTLRFGNQVIGGTLAEVLYRGIALPTAAALAGRESK